MNRYLTLNDGEKSFDNIPLLETSSAASTCDPPYERSSPEYVDPKPGLGGDSKNHALRKPLYIKDVRWNVFRCLRQSCCHHSALAQDTVARTYDLHFISTGFLDRVRDFIPVGSYYN